MNRPRVLILAGLLAAAAAGIALRLPRLDQRPMHGDEANQAVKAGNLLESGVYRYDPSQHHGPTLYYLTLPAMWLSDAKSFADATEPMLRIVPVLFGIGLILLVGLLADGLGRPAAAAAALLTAISPAMVFYSRYYIQEMLLVFFTLGAIAAAWRYVRTRRTAWLLASGACFGLMHATKETWVLAAAAMAAALAMAAGWARWRDGAWPQGRTLLSPQRVLAAAGAGAGAAILFFSSFFTNLRGPLDSILAYGTYLQRAGGDGLHDNPWYYYVGMLTHSRLVTRDLPVGWPWAGGAFSLAIPGAGPWWTEGLILGLAVIGLAVTLARKTAADPRAPLLRFLAFYTVVVTVLYSAIPYKTPWCVLTMLSGMILLAGVGAAALVRWEPTWPLKTLGCLVLAALAAHLVWQAHRASFRFPADQRNPYVYAHTSTDVRNLVRLVDDAATVSPQGRDMLIKVITPENYWPLPWYLRRFNPDHVGYYHDVPEDADAPVVITSLNFHATLDARLRKTYNKQSLYGLRPMVLMSVYVEEGLWEALQARRAAAIPAPKSP